MKNQRIPTVARAQAAFGRAAQVMETAPASISEVAQSCQNLQAGTNELALFLSQLEERLAPVLRPPSPENANSIGHAPGSVPLTLQLGDTMQTVGACTARVLALLDRLAI